MTECSFALQIPFRSFADADFDQIFCTERQMFIHLVRIEHFRSGFDTRIGDYDSNCKLDIGRYLAVYRKKFLHILVMPSLLTNSRFRLRST